MAQPKYLSDIMGGDPISMIEKGYLGPDVNVTGMYNMLNEMLGQTRQGGASYLANASQGAGYVPKGLSARTGAIVAGEGQKAAASVAASMSAQEQSRYDSALGRLLNLWMAKQDIAARESAAEGGLWGNLMGGLMGIFGSAVAGRSEGNALASILGGGGAGSTSGGGIV